VLVTEDGGGDFRLVAQRKANYARLCQVERYRVEEIMLPDRIDPNTGDRVVTARMVFVEYADDVDSADVLGPQKTTKTETAETLLKAMLADGDWHESDGLKKLLAAAGYGDHIVKRAAKDLGVAYERRGFPASTWWRLPVGTPLVGTFTTPTNVPAEGLDVSGPPAVTIYLPFEGGVRLWVDAMNDSEEGRLWDWIGSRDDLLALVARALELAEEAKAA
jgi:hypothetical protein